MNIFYLDHSASKAAMYHCDKHVVKMILESAQILCTVAQHHSIDAPYKATHSHHPCTTWSTKSSNNIIWLADLMFWLNIEYKHRYGHQNNHMSYDKLLHTNLISKLIHALPNKPFSPPPQCMPDEYRHSDTIQAYRQYYAKGKAHLHSWSKRNQPFWLEELK